VRVFLPAGLGRRTVRSGPARHKWVALTFDDGPSLYTDDVLRILDHNHVHATFFQIGQQQNSSLAVVAPGISEALFATAIGLFAAIPAVIAYNRFSNAVNAFEARLQRFADRFHVTLSRELEAE